MSAKATFWAWEQDIPSSYKIVLLCYAQYANDNDMSWPSKETVSRQCGCGKSTVKRAVQYLCDNGFMLNEGSMVTSSTGDGKQRETTVYKLSIGEISTRSTVTSVDSNQGHSEPTSPDSTRSTVNQVHSELGSNEGQLGPNDALLGSQRPQLDSTRSTMDPKSINKYINKLKTKYSLDFSTWPCLPDDQLLDDWLKAKKRAKGSISQSAINTVGSELHKAVLMGFTVDECLKMAENSGWRGFKVEWMGVKNHNTAVNTTPYQPSKGRQL